MASKDVYLPGRTNNIPVGLGSRRVFSGPSATNLPVRQLPANNSSIPLLSATYSSTNNSSFTNVYSPDYSANNLSGLGFSATDVYVPNFSVNGLSEFPPTDFGGEQQQAYLPHFYVNGLQLPLPHLSGNGSPEFPATDFGGAWDLGIDSCDFLIGQTDDLDLPDSGIGRDLDNTLEALTHVSQSLPISSKEAIGVQNENNRSGSSVQNPIDEKKGKRIGRPKIEITLEDLLQYKDDTVKVAAFNLGVSESTVDRRVKELTNMTWSFFQRSMRVRKDAR